MAGSSNTSVQDEKGLKMGNRDMRVHEADLAEDRKNWAMEVYQGTDQADEGSAAMEGVLEFDLDEEEAEQVSKYLAIAVHYSRKSYNPQALFADMLAAWRIQNLSSLEKIGDYNFRLEFAKEDEKRRAIEGVPWRHKGDALIVIHYDGLSRPSEVRSVNIGLWVRFYDLPPAMMKEPYVRQLGNQISKYVSLDTRYPGYMRVRVEFPLNNPLVPSLTVKIKGRGAMPITLRYENVPHFCFTCG
jgi:hypothetical protein